jgi:geranylgeranyl diphosphate synthase type I
MGTAFQVVDDLLGVWGDPAVTGKPVYGDLRERKKTFPVLAALDSPAAGALAALVESAAEPAEVAALIEESGGRSAGLAEARRHVAAAEAALADVPLAAGAVEELRSLLDFLVRRDL